MIPTEAISLIDILQLLVLPVLLPAVVGLATRWQPVGNLPTLAKRLILAALALTTQILTEFLQAVGNGTEYNLNTLYWSLFLGGIAILTAELAYQGWYKAPIQKTTPPEPVEVQLTPTGRVSKSQPALSAVVEQAAPVTLASVIGGQK